MIYITDETLTKKCYPESPPRENTWREDASTCHGRNASMSETTIVCEPNEPYCVSGTFTVKDAQGDEVDCFGQDTVYLCRCGYSTNKPFCDGSHEERGFAG
jgi:iron-binding CDGSH zinc finger protein